VIINDRDVKALAAYLQEHQARRPPDHLVSEWMNAETKQACKLNPKPWTQIPWCRSG